MSKRTYVYNPETGKHEERRGKVKQHGHDYHIMPDIEPYQPVGPEQDSVVGSRKAHREYLKRNGLVEVGNEFNHMTRWGGKTYDNRDRDPSEFDW